MAEANFLILVIFSNLLNNINAGKAPRSHGHFPNAFQTAQDVKIVRLTQ
jgi:hypothetical protein